MYSWYGIECKYKDPFPSLTYAEKMENYKNELLRNKPSFASFHEKLSVQDFEERASLVKKAAEEISAKDMKMDSFIKCRKCGCREIFSYDKQTRSADEGATRFFECTNNKCGFKWRT